MLELHEAEGAFSALEAYLAANSMRVSPQELAEYVGGLFADRRATAARSRSVFTPVVAAPPARSAALAALARNT